MQTPLSQPQPLTQGPAFQDPTGWPAWWSEGRAEAWAEYSGLPFPKRKDEDWRFADLRKVTLEGYVHQPQPDLSALEFTLDRSKPDFSVAGQAVFADNTLLLHSAVNDSLKQQGVTWEPLSAALTHEPDLLKKSFMTQPVALGSQKFAALHRAYCQSGMLIHIPKGVKVELPLMAYHWLVGDRHAVFPHTLIVAEEGSEVTVIDVLQSGADQEGFACCVNDLIVGPGAKVTYTCLQQWSEKVLSFQINATEVARDAQAKSLHINLGSAYARLESQGRLIGKGARSEMLAISVGHGAQNFDQRTLQYHEGEHTWSDLLYKNALSHRSRSVFKGLIQVAPHARWTDAYQTNRNLLLDPEAEADSMPGLEILNDDVKCSHGATTGQVDPEELFYLLARGISPVVAKQLMVDGFLGEVIERLGHEGMARLAQERIGQKFQQTRALGTGAQISDSDQQKDFDSVDPSLAVA